MRRLLRTTLLFTCGCVAAINSAATAGLVTNPSFETPEDTFIFGFPGLPSTYGDWGGDLSAIVTAENSILPRTGSRMLRFDATGNEADGFLTTSQIRQWIDISPYQDLIRAGRAEATVSAWFNRVPGDDETDTSQGISLYAFTGTMWDFNNYVAQGFGVLTDGDVSTWEQASGTWLLPTNTNFLAIEVSAYENVKNDGVSPEFDGHYADDVFLAIRGADIPEPSTIVLLLLGGLGLAFYWIRNGEWHRLLKIDSATQVRF